MNQQELWDPHLSIGAKEQAINRDDIQQRERFERAARFADENASDFPVGKPSGDNVAILRAACAELSQLEATQSTSGAAARQATQRKGALLAAVRADLAGMSKVARALDDERPGLALEFKLPDNKRDEALLAAARSQLQVLEAPATGAELVELFLDFGMRPGFVADLKSDIALAESAAGAQDVHGGDRREDTLAIDAQIEAGIRAVAKLDAYCGNRFADDAALLGEWKSASHLELRRVHPHHKAA